MKCGIVGLPNVGKSTIFNALTMNQVPSENYPFCTIEPNIGRVSVPDPRLTRIQKVSPAEKMIPTTMEFVDIAGLVKGAASGEGLGNKFLGHIRSTDAICHVVRCFEDDDVTHVDGSIDPVRDITTIDTELIIADLETIQNAITRYNKLAKSGKEPQLALSFLSSLQAHLETGKAARSFISTVDEAGDQTTKDIYRDLHLITAKPVIYICNVEEDLASGTQDNEATLVVRQHANPDDRIVLVSGKIEAELSQLPEEERSEMLSALGIHQPGLDRLIIAGYYTLGLKTFFTAGPKEIRAWTTNKDAKAPKAAGVIHSDFERGFICCEVYQIEDLEKLGSKSRLKEQGLLRIEGREYILLDGDVVEFRFNV